MCCEGGSGGGGGEHGDGAFMGGSDMFAIVVNFDSNNALLLWLMLKLIEKPSYSQVNILDELTSSRDALKHM